MKKIIAIALAVAVLLPAAALASDANQMKYVQLLAPTASLSTTGTVTDISAYKGNAALAVLISSTAVATTTTVTFSHALASTGTWSTVTNLAGTAGVVSQVGPDTNDVQTFAIDLARLHKYVRAVVLQSGEDTNVVSALLIAPMKSE